MTRNELLEKELYTVGEVGEIFNVPIKYIYKKINEGNIRFIKLGKKYLIMKSELNISLERNT
jgi:excisionase family DNA binding protein